MAKFFIENFGCRATDADAAGLRNGLLGEGLQPWPRQATADVVVLNTCTVTAAADSQAREAIRKIHRANPSATIVVTGCYAQRAPEEISALAGVTWVVGNARQTRDSGIGARGGEHGSFVPLGRTGIDRDVSRARPGKNSNRRYFRAEHDRLSWNAGAHEAGHVAGERTRPILKVQDGCNNRCAYCVIPFVRGRSRSLPPDARSFRSAAVGGGRRKRNRAERDQPGKLWTRSESARGTRCGGAANPGRNVSGACALQFHRAAGCDRGFCRAWWPVRSIWRRIFMCRCNRDRIGFCGLCTAGIARNSTPSESS